MIQTLESMTFYGSLVGLYPLIHYLLVSIVRMAPANYLNDRIQGFMDRRQAQPGPKGDVSDFLTKLIDAHHQSPGRFTELHILLGCSSNVIAGSDTTSIALSSTIFHLFREPSTLAKLREELNKATAAGKVSVPIKFSESLELKYLQAVVKEALRINPSTGFPMGRVVPPGGAVICDAYFPPGVC